jgi:hypothetical protein
MKYVVEMGSGATIYIPGFVRTGSGIENLIGRDSQTAWRLRKVTPQ